LDLIHAIEALRSRLKGVGTVAFVPTMGNLHQGHLSLVEIARQRGQCVVASIFVNRLQFEPGGDFERYPRTLARDCELLAKAGCDVVFAPDERELYPEPQEIFVMPPPAAEQQLCGAFRPGHFQGVLTVVTKLFNIVQPHVAVFGKKDFQQLFLIRGLVRQLSLPIEIVGGDTVRESDGLAMSSRNGYLDAEERAEAVRLSRNLKHIKREIELGSRDFARLVEVATADLASHGWKLDYIAVRSRERLDEPAPADRALAVLGAAWLGRTRLIDNLEVDAPGSA
jgi:pantoate--beta-alanine ligase